MLVVALPELLARTSSQVGHIHAVVVDELYLAIRHDKYVSVLKIAVGHTDVLKGVGHLDPTSGECDQARGIAQVSCNIGAEGIAIDPLHLKHRIPLAIDEDALA